MLNDSAGWMGNVGGPWGMVALALVAVILVAVLRGRAAGKRR